ncbi:MAG: DUF4912 domain-containing protein [Leptolyngbyaceae cyanobacterium SL_1_1]|nr:DUF4912 domain-containing protein [Leptolyngbyaceae cyanobacterium SL_1_1]
MRGDITDWSVVGGPVSSIRLLDRPADSQVRAALSRYAVFGPQFLTGANTQVINSDNIETLVQALGSDGITYGLVSELGDRPDLRTLTIDGVGPAQAGYPFSLTRTLVYQEPLTPQAQALLTFLSTPLAQETLQAADRATAESISTETVSAQTDVGEPETDPGEIAPPDDATGDNPLAPEWQTWLDSIPEWARWVVMPLVLLVVLLGAALKGQSEPKSSTRTTKILPPATDADVYEDDEPEVRIEIPDLLPVAPESLPEQPPIANPEDKLTQARLALAEGIRQADLGHYETALNCLHQAIEAADLERLKATAGGTASPSLAALLAGSLIRRGMVLAKVGRADEARESFDAALALQPASITALRGKHALLQQRQPEGLAGSLPADNSDHQGLTEADTIALTGSLPDFPDLIIPANGSKTDETALSGTRLPINWPDLPQLEDIKPTLETDKIADFDPVTMTGRPQSSEDVPETLLQAIEELPAEAENVPWLASTVAQRSESEAADVPADLQAAIAELPEEAAILPWAKPAAAKLSLMNTRVEAVAPAPEPIAPLEAATKPDQDLPEDILQAMQVMPDYIAQSPAAVRAQTATIDATQSPERSLDQLSDQPPAANLSLSRCDSQWAYAHWDLSPQQIQQLADSNSLLALRLYDVTDWQPQQPLPRDFQQQECYRMARDWYLPIAASDRSYLVELGYFTPDKRWQKLVRSAPLRF